MKKFLRPFFFCLGLFLTYSAAFSEPPGLDGLADKAVSGPLTVLLSYIDETCFVIGAIFLMLAVNKYFGFRRNPHAFPLGSVITYILLGLALIALPFVLYLMNVPIKF